MIGRLAGALALVLLAGGAQFIVRVPTPPAATGLLHAADFTYLGGFRMPNTGSNGYTFQYSRDGGIAFDSVTGHLYVTEGYGLCTINIPTLVNTATSSAMNEASWQQACVDPAEGNLYTDLGANGTGAFIGGLLVDANYVYLSGYGYYWQPGDVNQVSHWRRNRTISTNDYAGLEQVWDPVTPADSQAYVSILMFKVPSAWQAALGGTAIAAGCCIPIVSRTSQGLAMVSFDYTRIYSETPPHPGNLLAANTLGTFNVGTDLTYNATTEVHGCAIIDNTKTLVCGIRHGDGGATPVCYGPTPTPCTDPEETAEAWHAYPYHHKLWLYNLDHLAEAKAGTRDPADVDPYETVELNFPLQGTKHTTLGLTYDSANHRLYFAQGSAHDSGAGAMIPVIQGFSVNAP